MKIEKMDRESSYEGIGLSLKDLMEANIFCDTCEKGIVSLKNHMDKEMTGEELREAIEKPLNKRFEGHIDHRVKIIFNASCDSIAETLNMIMFMHNQMIKQETCH